ncbi:MAG: hypothetical protein HFE66_07870 [Clostridiales bacterium]|jgi:hypothetical protein|nr:hypothetical protein [Clostridiales bacterium]
MHSSVLDAVRELRGETDLAISKANANRYRIVIHEQDGAQTAYYFSAPIYHLAERTLASLRFTDSGTLQGTNGMISVFGNTMTLTKKQDKIYCDLGTGSLQRAGAIMIGEGIEIHPTLNGAAVKLCCDGEGTTIRIRTERPFWHIRANSKYFALMEEPFQPLLVLSGIGAFGDTGELYGGVKMSFQKVHDQEFTVWICSTSEDKRTLWFEINLYEPKLFLDTTVESRHPSENNAYGSTAFLGTTYFHGNQWLYTRPDYAILADVQSRELDRVQLYLPRYAGKETTLSGVTLSRRFCSFGSTWENKVDTERAFGEGRAEGRYHMLDLTNILVDPENHMLRQPDGWVLRAKNGGYTAVSTGDSSFFPQILAVRFR